VVSGLKTRVFAVALAGVFFIGALSCLIGNDLRGWSGPDGILSANRVSRYFNGNPLYRESYLKVVEFAGRQGGPVIGLDAPIERYEYPLLTLLGCDQGRVRVRLVGVENQSRVFEKTDETPETTICMKCAHLAKKWEQYTSQGAVGAVMGDIVVFGKNLRVASGEEVYGSFAAWKEASSTAGHKRELHSWVGPDFSDRMSLQNSARWLLVQGQVFPRELDGPLPLEILVDRQIVGSATITKTQVDDVHRALGLSPSPGDGSGPYSFFLALPVDLQSGDHGLEFRTNAWFTGQDKYGNGDQRRLSYKLHAWDSRYELPEVFFRFADGWYDYEGSEAGWRRWCRGRGEVEMAVSEDQDFVLSGSAASISPDNKVEIALNGTKVSELVLGGENRGVAIPETRLALRKGRNVLTFAGSKRTLVANDPRELSFSILHLVLKSARDGKDRSCLVD